jgi:amino acid transporter
MKIALTILALCLVIVGFANFFRSLNEKELPISIMITHPLLILSIAYLLFQYLFPLNVYRGDRQAIEQHASSLSKSNLISSMSCGGRIGWFSGPLLRVQLFENGMIVHPLFMPRFAIDFSEIKSVDVKTGLLRTSVEIIHSSQQVQNPIILNCSSKNPLVLKLQSHVKQI